MPGHDGGVGDSEGAGGTDVFEVAATQELGADHAGEGHPGEDQQEAEQDPEAGREDAAEDDEKIEVRHAGPDLDEALEQQVGEAAVEALNGPGGDADDGADQGEGEAEQDGDAEAVDDAGQDVPRLVVGAQQVAAAGRGRGGDGEVLDDGVVAVAERRPQHPSLGLDGLLELGVGEVGLGGQEVGAERVLGIVAQDRGVELALKRDQQGAVVGDELGEQAEDEEDGEDDERDIAAAVGAEGGEAAGGDGGQCRASKSMRGSTTV